MRKVACIALLALLLPLTGCGGSYVVISGEPDSITLPPCPTEDSGDNCYWNAREMGNGEGTSFVVIGGVVYYPKGS